jgi:hypothetical protein
MLYTVFLLTDLKKTDSTAYQKNRETRKLVNRILYKGKMRILYKGKMRILYKGKMRIENQTNIRVCLRRLEFMPRNLDKKCRSRIESLASLLLINKFHYVQN